MNFRPEIPESLFLSEVWQQPLKGFLPGIRALFPDCRKRKSCGAKLYSGDADNAGNDPFIHRALCRESFREF